MVFIEYTSCDERCFCRFGASAEDGSGREPLPLFWRGRPSQTGAVQQSARRASGRNRDYDGPSGSGKTTLLTLIGSLRTVQEGSLQVLGEELRGASSEQIVCLRRKMGFIFQAHNLFESLTAYQNVNMAAELQGMDPQLADERIKSLLTRLGLGERIHYKPKSLSGGQKPTGCHCTGAGPQTPTHSRRRTDRRTRRKIGARSCYFVPGTGPRRRLHDHHGHAR